MYVFLCTHEYKIYCLTKWSVPQGGQAMQFAPWLSGAIPQVWAGGLQAGTLPAGGLLAPNPIFIRGTQPDAPPSMFIQHSPQNVQHTS